MGLNQAVQERLEAMQISDPLTRRIHIKMSGCPNGCAPAPHRQHRLLRRLDQGRRPHRSPPTSPHLGGNYEGGEVVYGHRLKARLPAKRVPDAVERWVRFYEAERDDGEEFNDFVERVGTDRVRGAGQGPRRCRSSSASRRSNQFIDWSRSEPYKVERGEGECAV